MRPEVLYVFTQEGCDHCVIAKRELVKFQAANPDVFVHMLDETHTVHTVQGMTPRALPAYLFVIGGRILEKMTHLGPLKAKELAAAWAKAVETETP